ncbi:DUF6949 family protein [Rhizobium sp.]
MINAGDLFICVVTGLAMPLAMLDGYRALAGAALQEQVVGWHGRRGPVVLLLAILLGPGLFVEKMLTAWRRGELSPADRVNALVIALGWAALYGFVVLGFVRMTLPI